MGIQQCNAFALYLAHIRSHWSAVADQKKHLFSTITFFFIIGNDFRRFVGQTSITSIFLKYVVRGKKGEKNQAPPVIEIAPPPQISSPGYGPEWGMATPEKVIVAVHARCLASDG